MSDPYAQVCVRGVIPLVKDPAAPGGVRFAVAMQDPPEDCIVRIDDLPDAEMCLQLFSDGTAMSAWTSGVREFAGNAVSVILPETGEPCALVVRHDRPRLPGATVDEVIMLRERLGADPAEGPASSKVCQDYARSRIRAAARAHEQAQYSAWTKKWASEIAFVQADRTLGSHHYGTDKNPEEPFDFHNVEKNGFIGMNRYRLHRDGDILWMGFDIFRPALDRDLQDLWRERLAAKGLSVFPDFRVATRIEKLDRQTFAHVKRIEAEFVRINEDIERTQAGRNSVAKSEADKSVMRVIQRIAAGCYVIHDGTGSPADQISPRTATPQPVPRIVLNRAIEQGLVSEIGFDEPVPGYRTPRFYGLTAAGRMLAAGDGAAAAGIVMKLVDAAAEREDGNRRRARSEGPFLAVAARHAEHVSEKDRRILAAAVAPKLAEASRDFKTFLRGRTSADGWLMLAAGAVAGVLAQGAKSTEFVFSAPDEAISPSPKR